MLTSAKPSQRPATSPARLTGRARTLCITPLSMSPLTAPTVDSTLISEPRKYTRYIPNIVAYISGALARPVRLRPSSPASTARWLSWSSTL